MQSCLTLYYLMDHSPPNFSVHDTVQAILEWVAISFCRGSSLSRDRIRVSCIAGRCFTTEPPGKPKICVTNTLSTPVEKVNNMHDM